MKVIVKKFNTVNLAANIASWSNQDAADYLNKLINPKDADSRIKLDSDQLSKIESRYGLVINPSDYKNFKDLYRLIKSLDPIDSTYKSFKIKSGEDLWKYLIVFGSVIHKSEFSDYDMNDFLNLYRRDLKKLGINNFPKNKQIDTIVGISSEDSSKDADQIFTKAENFIEKNAKLLGSSPEVSVYAEGLDSYYRIDNYIVVISYSMGAGIINMIKLI